MTSSTLFSINRDDLVSAGALLSKVRNQRVATVPILSHLYIECNNDEATLVSSGDDMSFTVTISLEKPSTAKTTLPMRKLLDIAKSTPNGSVLDFKLHKDVSCVIICGKSRYRLNALPAKDYPLPELPDGISFKVNAKAFQGILKTVSHAQAKKDIRHVLNGMLIRVNKTSIEAVATDGHRLARGMIDSDNNHIDAYEAILPVNSVSVINSLHTDKDDELKITLCKNAIIIEHGSERLYTKTIDGRFPDYKKVIPNKVYTFKLNIDAFMGALNRCSILSHESFRGVVLGFKRHIMTIKGSNPYAESADEEINYNGDPVNIHDSFSHEVGFNVDYLRDAVASTDGDNIELSLNNECTSSLINSSLNPTNERVIMAMRL